MEASLMVQEGLTDDPDGSIEREIEQQLEIAERRVKRLRAALIAYRGANPPVEPLSDTESRRWLRKSGKPMRPIEVMLILLRSGEIPTKELYAQMVEGGCFRGKANPESAFRLSIKLNVKLGKIIQTDAGGLPVEELDAAPAPLAGVTRLKKIRPIGALAPGNQTT
jgi:hypothetical protein